MRLIDGDALEKFLSDAEVEATKRKKYVLAGALNVIQGNVRNFPTIEPESKWIPCSERLPSKEECKEWIDKNLDGIGYLYPCLVTRYSSIHPERTKNNPYVAKHYYDGEDFVNNGEEVCSEYIVAWQPLPEPYKGEGDHHDD